jgi:hypothetical protein
MGGTLTDWLPDNPFRSVAWRWERAVWLASRGARTYLGLDDRWVLRARDFLASSNRVLNVPEHAASTDPDVSEAWQLSRDVEPLRHWRAQAYLLTDLPLQDVALRCSMPLATLHAYTELFFHVRPHLKARDWIQLRAVGGGPQNNFNNGELGCVWKSIAFSGGVFPLEVALSVTMREPLPAWVHPPCGESRAFYEARLRGGCMFLIKAMTAESDAELGALLGLYNRFRRLTGASKETCGPGPMVEVMEDSLKASTRRRRSRQSKRTTGSKAIEKLGQRQSASAPSQTRGLFK